MESMAAAVGVFGSPWGSSMRRGTIRNLTRIWRKKRVAKRAGSWYGNSSNARAPAAFSAAKGARQGKYVAAHRLHNMGFYIIGSNESTETQLIVLPTQTLKVLHYRLEREH
jgi:hypothetical protein